MECSCGNRTNCSEYRDKDEIYYCSIECIDKRNVNKYTLKCPRCHSENLHIIEIDIIKNNILDVVHRRNEKDLVLNVSCESYCGIKSILIAHYKGITSVIDIR